MRKTLLLAVLILIPAAAFAQSGEDWRNRSADRDSRYYNRGDNAFELTPSIGYRYGGTIYADQSNLFNRDVDVASSAAAGVTFGIPIAPNGIKLELMANHQSTSFTGGSGLFTPNQNLGDFDINYYQAGLLVPFAESRNVTPFIVFGAGIANLAPDIPGISVASSNRFAGNIGIGAKIPINRNLALRIEARGYFTSLNNNNDDNGCSSCYYSYNHDLYQGETNIGLTFRF